MAGSLHLDPNTIYDEGAVSLVLGIPESTLDRARREGRLRFSRKGRRIFFRGQWLLDWFVIDRAVPEAKSVPLDGPALSAQA